MVVRYKLVSTNFNVKRESCVVSGNIIIVKILFNIAKISSKIAAFC